MSKDIRKQIDKFRFFEGRNVTYNIKTKNRIEVEKNGTYLGGWNVKYSSKLGKGHSLIFDNTSKLSDVKLLNMKDDEMYLFGISTTPPNSGVGRVFLMDIFDYSNMTLFGYQLTIVVFLGYSLPEPNFLKKVY